MLQDRDQALVHNGDYKRHPRGEGILCFVCLRKWHHHHGLSQTQPPSFFPTPHVPLVTLLSLLAPELCSHACAGQASSPFPGWPPSPLRGPPVMSPHSPDGSLTATSLCPTILHLLLVLSLHWFRPLGHAPNTTQPLFSSLCPLPRGHFFTSCSFLAPLLAPSPSAAFSPGQSLLECLHTSFPPRPPSPGSQLLVLKA